MTNKLYAWHVGVGRYVEIGRTPCINPRCRRTYKQEREGEEIICGKCFRALPERLRVEHRSIWREIRKWDRRVARSIDEFKRQRMHDLRGHWVGRLNRNWEAIKTTITSPDEPEGLDAFLKEIGL